MMVPHYLLILTLAVAASARTASTNKNTVDEARGSEDTVLGDLKVAYETYRECSGSELASCLKRKLAKAINKISESDELSLLGGVTITKDKDAKVNDVEVEEAIPRGLDESSLDNLIVDKIVGFMQTHTIQVKFPSSSDLQSAEGRSRRKKLAPLLAIPLLIGGMLVPLAFGALALLAGKALIVSKLALVLAGIIGLKKLLSPSGGGGEAHEVVVSSAGHGGSGWSRSLKAQDLAYNAYVKQQ